MTSLFADVYDDDLRRAASLEDIDERRTAGSRAMRRSDNGNGDVPASGPWSLRTIVALVALGGMIFAAGENWHRIDALTDEFHVQVAQNKDDHARIEAEKADRGAIDQHFTSLERQIDELQKFLERKDGRR